MRFHWWVAILTFLVSESAICGSCGPSKEYAQYKDGARTKQGRLELAGTYCLYKRLHALQQTESNRRECSQEEAKILDAISGDQSAIKKALGGCPEVYDKKP